MNLFSEEFGEQIAIHVCICRKRQMVISDRNYSDPYAACFTGPFQDENRGLSGFGSEAAASTAASFS